MPNIQSPTISNPKVLDPVNPAIENYMRSLVSQTDHPVLTEMEKEAENNNFPIIGRLVGIFLETMTRAINAKRVFEFGSGYGYSAYWFAKAVGEEGIVVCSDGDPLNKERAEKYLSSVELGNRLNFHTGYAQEIFSELKDYLISAITMQIKTNTLKSGLWPRIESVQVDYI